MVVVKVVDHDVLDKVDTQYIEDQFADLPNIGIVFICTREGGEEDEWTEADGQHYIVIHLPYEVVRKSQDVRPMMLEKARARLGMVG